MVFVAVHVGAGKSFLSHAIIQDPANQVTGLLAISMSEHLVNNSRSNTPQHFTNSDLFGRACRAAMTQIRKGGTSLEAVAAAIAVLEDDPSTNSGTGSNLTLQGTVECDASIMTDQGRFGAVGAVAGIKNPIYVAKKLLEVAQEGLLPLGRVSPIFMVGPGAGEWAKEHGLETTPNSKLLTDSSLNTYLNHMRRYHEANDSARSTKRFKLSPDAEDEIDSLGHDTVGAICVDAIGNVASGVSSGGISLKFPGRIGEAAIFGSGCWAQKTSGNADSMACSCTGTGEQLMLTSLSQQFAFAMQENENIHEAMKRTLKSKFLDDPVLDTFPEKNAGLLALKYTSRVNDSRCDIVELCYGHTTQSMGIGYMSANHDKPQVGIFVVELCAAFYSPPISSEISLKCLEKRLMATIKTLFAPA
ncbi:hypothetical protein NQZ79_g1597 [Umbelopsis isabellina]|nr:hypothetical protein NQZ79_g1597 [Umbelopsis isabellina]